MKLIVVRHAETNYNAKDLINYDPTIDVHLTEKGIKQAEELAKKLKDFQFNAIYISQLNRTRQTADITNQYHNQNITTSELLDDMRNGFEGQSYQKLKDWRSTQKDPISARYMNKFESIADMTDRVQKFLDHLKTHHQENETILVITSSHLVKQLRLLTGEFANYQELLAAPTTPQTTYYTFEI